MSNEFIIKRRKKLIEVAIPLDAINEAAAAETQPGIGPHPRGLHLWWARRPLTAAKAVLFCQMVDDPSEVPEKFPSKKDQDNERKRLFNLIEELICWKNRKNSQIIDQAKKEIMISWKRCCLDNASHPEAMNLFNPEVLPDFHDPFAGGGTIPSEAQLLGLNSYASDLNPVAVLINKSMIEIPLQFSNYPPINPKSNFQFTTSNNTNSNEGIAEDIKFYGDWMRKKAEEKIGNFYPKIKVTSNMIIERSDLKAYEQEELEIIAWIWSRTVKSPNPAFSNVDVPLISNFMLSTKNGKEVYIEPIINGETYELKIRIGKPCNPDQVKKGTKLSRGANFKCILSGTAIDSEHIKNEGMKGNMGQKLICIVAKGRKGKIYLDPSIEQENIAKAAQPSWRPDNKIFGSSQYLGIKPYGMDRFDQLFTSRQLLGLTTFSDLISDVNKIIREDFIKNFSKRSNSSEGLIEKATSYANSVCLYLSFAISRLADYNSAISTWKPSGQQVMHTFTRAAIQMTWDFPESNTFGSSSICWKNCIKYTSNNLLSISNSSSVKGFVMQDDAQTQNISTNKIISTDPPYFDNIPYADLSDFFYVWLKKCLEEYYPSIFRTLGVPKLDELVAAPHRQGGKSQAEKFFLEGMTKAIKQISYKSHPCFPLTIYYAFKQTEKRDDKGVSSTGWETFLASILDAGMTISGTWPLRTEMLNRVRGLNSNALASSMLLVCNQRERDLTNVSKKDFRRELRKSLPKIITKLENSNIAPVDLDQASIGPGISLFSKSNIVLNNDDSRMSMRDALIEIGNALDECLAQDESDLDNDSRFALAFFEKFGYGERPFGDAEGIAKAKNISVDGVCKAGIFKSIAGRARLLQRQELPENWDPTTDSRLCIWEITQYLIKKLESGGEIDTANLMSKLNQLPNSNDINRNTRALSYRLYNFCEKTKMNDEARAYNSLIIAWPEIERLAADSQIETTIQSQLF